jgi:hypothetical protein
LIKIVKTPEPGVDVKAPHPEGGIFDSGPPFGLWRLLGLADADRRNTTRRIAFVILIGWAPIVVLTLVQKLFHRSVDVSSLVHDTGVHARYLFAAPLLVFAEFACGRRLSSIIRNFAVAGLIPTTERTRYEAAVTSTRILVGSKTAEIIIITIALLVAVAAASSYPVGQIPPWHTSAGVVPVFSLAGWWHVLVSLPLLTVLILGWVWRYALWTRLLWRIARLDLRLVASHPDHAAGLGFLGHSVRAGSSVAMPFAVILAGRSLHLVLLSLLPRSHLPFIAAFLSGLVGLVIARFWHLRQI